MNQHNNEKNSKYIRFSHTVRVIAITLLITLSSSQIHNCYASLNNIEYNTSQTATNTANINTKMGNIYTALSTLYSYLSNNGNGVRELLSYIYNYESSSNTYLSNIWSTMNSASYGLIAQGIKLYDIDNDILAVGGQLADVSSKLLTANNSLSNINSNISNVYNSLENIGWTDRPITYSYHSSLSDAVSQTNNIETSGTYNVLYVRAQFTNYEPYNDALYFEFPVIPAYSSSIPEDEMIIDNVYALSNTGSSILLSSNDVHFDFRGMEYSRGFYIDGIGRSLQGGANFASRTTFIFEIKSRTNVYILAGRTSIAKSLTYGSEDYLKLANYLKLNNLSTDDVVQALQDLEVNVEVNDSINVTPIDLDVSIGIDDFTAVNTVSNKLRTWLTTGVSVSALIGALDDLDDSFFTLSNRNTIETINNQYTDFYD